MNIYCYVLLDVFIVIVVDAVVVDVVDDFDVVGVLFILCSLIKASVFT